MRHRVAGRHLGRDTAHRRALYRNLVTDFLRYERIKTTEAKAKEIRPLAEKMITLAKRGDLHARRQVLRFVYDPDVVKRTFDEIAPRMANRPGGYTRITALEPRKGDGARMAVLEMVDYAEALLGLEEGSKPPTTPEAEEEEQVENTAEEVSEGDEETAGSGSGEEPAAAEDDTEEEEEARE